MKSFHRSTEVDNNFKKIKNIHVEIPNEEETGMMQVRAKAIKNSYWPR